MSSCYVQGGVSVAMVVQKSAENRPKLSGHYRGTVAYPPGEWSGLNEVSCQFLNNFSNTPRGIVG